MIWQYRKYADITLDNNWCDFLTMLIKYVIDNKSQCQVWHAISNQRTRKKIKKISFVYL